MAMTVTRRRAVERRRIKISSKRQITIPQHFFDALNFDSEAECVIENNALVIRPVSSSDGTFAEQILEELVAKGLSGQELLAQFKEEQAKVRPAVEKMIAEADALAQSSGTAPSLDDLFGAED